MPLFDYRCQNGHTTERLTKGEAHIECPDCGEEAQKKITRVNFALDGTDPGFPSAYDKWADIHEKAGRQNSEGEG